MNSAHVIKREFFMAAIITLLAVVICLPSVVLADDLAPVNPPAEDNPPAPPSDIPVTCPPEDEWVTWPIEGPEDERIFIEKTGSSRIKFTRNDRKEEEELETKEFSTSPIHSVDPEFSAFLVIDPSSYALYNSLIRLSAARVN